MSRSFDGVDDNIDCGSATTLDNIFSSGGGSVCGWFMRLGAQENNNGYIVSKIVTGGWNFANANAGGTNRLVFFHFCSGNDLDVQSASNVFTDGVWYHVALVWDGSVTATNVHMYIDGNEVSYAVQTNGTGTPDSDATHNFIFGNRAATDRTLNGKLAHFHAYKGKMLSTNEIKIISRFPGSITSNLVGYWPLWGGSPEPDYSGNGNKGTVTGATVSSNNPPINGIFHPQRPNLYYSSFSSGVAPTSGTSKINRMMLMGVS